MNNKIIIETSARHIHLSQADLETLFGKGYELTKKKDLSQPGQFACAEKVKVVGTGLWQLQSLWFEKTLITTLFFCQIFDFNMLYGVV